MLAILAQAFSMPPCTLLAPLDVGLALRRRARCWTGDACGLRRCPWRSWPVVISRLGRWALAALLCSWMLVSAHFPWCIPGSRVRGSGSSLAALHGWRHFFPRGGVLLCVGLSSSSWSSTRSAQCLPSFASRWRSWWMLAGPVGGAPRAFPSV